jgi:hypothetical protein
VGGDHGIGRDRAGRFLGNGMGGTTTHCLGEVIGIVIGAETNVARCRI